MTRTISYVFHDTEGFHLIFMSINISFDREVIFNCRWRWRNVLLWCHHECFRRITNINYKCIGNDCWTTKSDRFYIVCVCFYVVRAET